ncbi:MAG: HK97 family phage prohead protease [Erythrobacter sp.]
MNTGAPTRLAGYAALFDIPDAARDIIRKGAFVRTLTERGDALALLWQHRPSQQVGMIEQISEDERGLRVIARIDRPHSRAASLLRQGAVNGLSFGYRANQFRRTNTGRELLDIDLFEISLVTQPLQHRARVHLVM